MSKPENATEKFSRLISSHEWKKPQHEAFKKENLKVGGSCWNNKIMRNGTRIRI